MAFEGTTAVGSRAKSAQYRPRVVIIGAGFGGLFAAKKFAGHPVNVTLIDENNYHTFFPLLYQVAAAEVEPEAIIFPVRTILRGIKNVRFALGTIEQIDFDAQVVKTANHTFGYDGLIIATGSSSSFFNIPGAKDFSFPIKDLEQGVALRNHVLGRFERASYESNTEERRRMLTFAIVGGGPTGVEFSGALMELIHGPLAKDHPELKSSDIRIILYEAGPRLLTALPSKLSHYAEKRLRKMGVEVCVNTSVAEISLHSIKLKDGSSVGTDTVVWTAGVRGRAPTETPLERSKMGRISVSSTLRTRDYPNVYVVGDLAMLDEQKGLPMVAQVAIQQGEYAAMSMLDRFRGKHRKPFRYHDKGTLAAIGRNAAVAQIGKLQLTGFFAWVVWLLVHLMWLIGFRNRLLVLTNWSWDYFFRDRPVRLMVGGNIEKPTEKTTRTVVSVCKAEGIGETEPEHVAERRQ